MKFRMILVLTLALGLGLAWPVMSQKKEAAKETRHTRFLPPPITDSWTQWIVGDWEGTGESNSGKGHGHTTFELALSGQFLMQRGEAVITELDPDYLKKHMQASDEEIERFKRSGYQSLELYTLDQETGEVIGFLFDNLRCLATGRGRREGFKETIDWEWRTGHKSTRVTERVNEDKLVIIERTRNTDGSIMEDKGEMIRRKRPAVSGK